MPLSSTVGRTLPSARSTDSFTVLPGARDALDERFVSFVNFMNPDQVLLFPRHVVPLFALQRLPQVAKPALGAVAMDCQAHERCQVCD
jgi:hypothetical protein